MHDGVSEGAAVEAAILCGVGAHEHLGLAVSVLEDSEEDGRLLLQVGRGQHPQAEGPHPALGVGALDAAQLLRVVGVRRVEGLRPVQARHLEAHLHVSLPSPDRSRSDQSSSAD